VDSAIRPSIERQAAGIFTAVIDVSTGRGDAFSPGIVLPYLSGNQPIGPETSKHLYTEFKDYFRFGKLKSGV
jgi:hypothetical protein